MSHDPVNPFVQHKSHSKGSLITYRILAFISLLLLVAIGIGFSVKAPPNGLTIWQQNEAHPTPFSLNLQIVWVYWYASHFSTSSNGH